MGASRVPVWSYLLLVFAGGAGVGVVADRLYTAKAVIAETRAAPPRNPDEFRARYIDEMTHRLKLSGPQVSQLTAVLQATQEQMRALHERDRPEMTAIHREQVDKVHAILDPNQSAEYDKMREEREKRRAAERK